jgi:glucuronoarabinoxylan endo-1,4-beta-xylanase
MTIIKILPLSLLILIAVPSLFAQSATVTWTTTYQTMDGFGGGETFAGSYPTPPSLTSAQLDAFFSTTNGIGFPWIRTGNYQDDVIHDLAILQGAVTRGAKIIMSLQSPPLAIKYSGVWNTGTINPTDGHSCFAGSTQAAVNANKQTWANDIVAIGNQYAAAGVPISVLSVETEPNTAGITDTFGECLYDATGIDDFVKNYLGPALAASSFHPRLALPETSGWFSPDYATTCLNDAGCAQYIDTINSHNYSSCRGRWN